MAGDVPCQDWRVWGCSGGLIAKVWGGGGFLEAMDLDQELALDTMIKSMMREERKNLNDLIRK